MTAEEFLQQLTDVLEADEPLQPGQQLADVETWDSLGVLSAVELYDQLGVKIDLAEVGDAETTDDLVALAGAAISR
jgi:acyl carrier protein